MKQPGYQRIILLPDERKDIKINGIIQPFGDDIYRYGTVVSVGQGFEDPPKEGSRVMYKAGADNENNQFVHEFKHYIRIFEMDIMARMDGEDVLPLADRILVDWLPSEQTTASGIIIPETTLEKPYRGKVLAVGNGIAKETMICKAGDIVLWNRYVGMNIIIKGKDFKLMKQSEIFGIVE
jgi:chaperonin GroES